MTTTISPMRKLRWLTRRVRKLPWFAVDYSGQRHAGRVAPKDLQEWLAENTKPDNFWQFTEVKVFERPGGKLVVQRSIELT